MSPVRRHFWHVVARVKSSLTFPRKWSLNWFMPAGVKSTEGSQVGTSTSLGLRACFLVSKKARYFSRSSSVFMGQGSARRDGVFHYRRRAHDSGSPPEGLGERDPRTDVPLLNDWPRFARPNLAGQPAVGKQCLPLQTCAGGHCLSD